MWRDLLGQVFSLPMQLLKRGIANPMGMFVYGILSKWYAIIFIASVITTYWVFKGLEKAGVLRNFNAQLTDGLSQVQSVAQNCVPLIMNVYTMWDCIQNPPQFVPDANSQQLEEGVAQDVKNDQDHLQQSTPPGVAHPYDTDDSSSTSSDGSSPPSSPSPTPSTDSDSSSITSGDPVNRI